MLKKNVVMIDPNNTIEYTRILLTELAKNCSNVYYITSKECHEELPNVNIYRWFYKSEDHIVVKATNYLYVYTKILILIIIKNINISHIQWFKWPALDIFFLKLLKLFTKVIYTAHNVLPHNTGLKELDKYKKIYNNVDVILVHGQCLKKEILHLFKINAQKIYIQKFGYSDIKQEKIDCKVHLPLDLQSKINNFKKIVCCIGYISPYKGTDRIIKIWKENFKSCPYLLVIAGFIVEPWEDFEEELKDLPENVIFINRRLSEEEFYSICKHSSFIALPYRAASMSGVVFSAAKSKKTILTTDVGTIPEYLNNYVDSIVVNNSNEDIKKGLKYLLSLDDNSIALMGNKLFLNISHNYKWDEIVKNMVNKCY